MSDYRIRFTVRNARLLRDVTDPEEIASRNEVAAQLGRVIDALEGLDAQIIRERFGIGTERCTLDELAVRHGLSRKRIREIALRAVRKLRHPTSGAAVLAEAAGIIAPSARRGIRHA